MFSTRRAQAGDERVMGCAMVGGWAEVVVAPKQDGARQDQKVGFWYLEEKVVASLDMIQ